MTKLWDEEPEGYLPKQYYDIDRAIALLERCLDELPSQDDLANDILRFIAEVKQPDEETTQETRQEDV